MDELKQFKQYGIIQRFVNETDAQFILSLRLDDKLSRFLSPTQNDITVQTAWIREYKKRELVGTEFYFITVDEAGERYGVNRLYNFDNDSFEVGSWLFKNGSPSSFSILSDLATRDYGFYTLGFKFCRFEVKKNNIAVLNYHKKFQPEITGEDEQTIFFRLSIDSYEIFKNKLLKIYNYGVK